MKPKKQKKTSQIDMLRNRLDQMLNRSHPLYVLSDQIDWTVFDEEFGKLYAEGGRPGIPTRVMVALHYLKHTFNESDESVVEKFVENVYWQHFCGFEYFQHEFPIDPSSMTRWRNRIGPEGMKKLLTETIETAKRRKDLTRHHAVKVNVDTTVQEKAIAFPTDQRLYQKAREKLVKEAKKRGIRLRQSYVRLGKRAFQKHSRYAHAKQWRRARKQSRKLRTYLGRVIRDIERKYPEPDTDLYILMEVAKAIHEQKRDDTNKVYSVHALEVECISKGKAHKRYEFGCKVGVTSTSRDNWVLDVQALHGNPYDGHTLKQSLKNAKKNSGFKVKQAFCDKGYRGVKPAIADVEIYLSGAKRLSRTLRRWLKRRSAIEPIIGHMKSDNRMDRNYLKGMDGDEINAILAGCGFNMRKLYRAVSLFIQILLGSFSQNSGFRVVGMLESAKSAA